MASASRALLLSRVRLHAGDAASRSVRTLRRPLAAATSLLSPPVAGVRRFATQPATSSLPDSSPNWSKRRRPTKEMAALDGCDLEHWLVVMEPPPGDASNPDIGRDEIIDSYIKTLAQVVGSEEQARQKIYSVSTRHYFAFGAIVSEELSDRLKGLPKVRWVLPDSYLDVKNKDYGGEPFINGEAVPYNPKYHEEWVRNYNLRRRSRHGRGNLSDNESDLNDGSDSEDQADGSNLDNGSDLNDQGDGSDSKDGSDLDDSSHLDNKGDGNNLDDGSDSDNRSGVEEATRMTETTRTTEATQTTRTTETTRTTMGKEVTQTTKTKEATLTTKTKEAARMTEATRTTEVTRTTKVTEATQTTKAKEATQTTKAKEATRTTKAKEATRTTNT